MSNRRLPTLIIGGVLLSLGIAATTPRASATNVACSDTVRSLYDALLANMQAGATLGADGHYVRIAPVVRRVFDMQFMTRLAIGPEWERLDDTQRRQVSEAFERYVAAIYAERFDRYSGETLRVTGELPSASAMIVTTEIVKSNGEPVRLNYLLHQNAGAWQIADVYLNGTISELATHRSEFAAILRSQGIDGLIGVLKAKAGSLTARAS